MQKHKALSITLSAAILVAACVKQQPNKFSDPTLVVIADLQDRRATDSLLVFLRSTEVSYRKAAALAFGSVQDSAASPALGNLLLEDPDASVRTSAAFALGQTGGFAAANALLPAADDKSPDVRREVLEALGKVLTGNDVDVLKKYKADDSLTVAGLAWGFYRLGVRGVADSVVAARSAALLDQNNNREARLAAAHFFSRSRINATPFQDALMATARGDKDTDVRMAATNALSKISPSKAKEAVKSILKNEPDERVRINAVRSAARLGSFDLLLTGLADTSVMVRVAASEGLTSQQDPDAYRLMEAMAANPNARVKSNIFAALFKTSLADSAYLKWKTIFEKEPETYSKAHMLAALTAIPAKRVEEAIGIIAQELALSKEFVIKSSAAQALTGIDRSNTLPKATKETMAKIYASAIDDGDRAVIAVVCAALRDEKLGYKNLINDYTFLTRAKSKLKLPEDYEAIEPLDQALAYFEGKPEPAKPANEFNHPIDWKLAKRIPRDQEVVIKTSKGEIRLRLLIEEAPGSVVNFYQLAERGYFNGKFFHRVVPNFVIQGGCNRGDGFGGENYSIRSEFSHRRYTRGSVGMASAGKDTEGTQWFITNSPTPHLDGGYSIFATTREGQSVVDMIEVGDKILNVTMAESKN